MPNKTQEYLNLAQQTAKELTRYWENWTDYLTTASRLYKYNFADQLMIYAQRPDATACASFDIWSNRMNRYVRRGSKGIALLDQSSSVPRLHYVFDVSDTGVRRNSRDPEARPRSGAACVRNACQRVRCFPRAIQPADFRPCWQAGGFLLGQQQR